MERILIVGAHYDDAELGCGGTAAHLIAEGKKVFKLTLTDNVTHFRQLGIKVEYETSAASSEKACMCLGVKEIKSFSPIECSKLVYSKEIMQEVEKIIFDNEIDTVFMHYNHDMNQDHIEASKITLTAARHCKNVLQYQSNGYIFDEPYYPNYFVDISDYVEQKRKALQQYGKEHNRFNKLFQINIERNHVWGYANQVEYAEGFKVVKMLRK